VGVRKGIVYKSFDTVYINFLLKRKGVSGKSGRMSPQGRISLSKMRIERMLRKKNLEILGPPNKETRSSKKLGE